LGRFTFDAQRIEIALYPITRGHFFHHKNMRISGSIGFEFREVTDKLQTNAEGRERIDRLASNLTTIGPGIFRYAFEPFFSPDPFGTIWLMRFYDHKTFFCITASG
jgi:hypothetical protein